ncbi:hypothetical protein [Ferrimonas kyonanensis]|uniref:hypothetical protein n=1 Tax=Ferrimonas kyonanensis TaxID=364763 RepID=UPI00047F199C|nr:hypothetical protein [Ferrimonas kyonanensis]
MTLPTQVTTELLEQLRAELQPQLDTLAQKLGISLQLGRIRYSRTDARMPVELCLLNASGTAVTPEMTALKALTAIPSHPLNGLDLSVPFESGGERFVLAGFNRRARKRPYLAKKVGDPDATYGFPANYVERLLGKRTA